MYKHILRGIQSVELSNKIEMPSLAELLTIPFVREGDINDVYKHGNEITKSLLSKIPLTNSKKYIHINVDLQYLTTEIYTIPTSNWHLDGRPVNKIQSLIFLLAIQVLLQQNLLKMTLKLKQKKN